VSDVAAFQIELHQQVLPLVCRAVPAVALKTQGREGAHRHHDVPQIVALHPGMELFGRLVGNGLEQRQHGFAPHVEAVGCRQELEVEQRVRQCPIVRP